MVKKSKIKSQVSKPNHFKIINLTQKMFPVPIYDSKGEIKFLNLRLQKRRRGQTPPVVSSQAITPALRQLEKKRMIKLEKV